MKYEDKVKLVLERCDGLKRAIRESGMPDLTVKERPLFNALVQAILSQQLAVKAAQTIYGRFEGLFDDGYITPSALAALTTEDLRSAGVSRQKSGYLYAIAKFFDHDQWQSPEWLREDEDVIVEKLVSIKGVGSWTAKMILMFNLGKEDIFPHEDLGIQLAMKDLYGMDGKGKVLIHKMEERAELWRPYRTHACRVLWRWKDGN